MKKWINVNNYEDLPINSSLKVISLFSGCGGKDLGMIGGFSFLGKYYGKNNIEVVFANDIVQHACDSYNQNLGHSIKCCDIREINEKNLPYADIVIGGFPCQDFSVAGNRKGFENTERGTLYLEMKRVISAVKPKVFVAENVEGLTNLNGTSTLDKIIDDFKSEGYNVEYHLFNAADYGVPQIRKRVIIIGIRRDLKESAMIPYPLPVCSKEEGTWITSEMAIDDLWELMDTGIVPNQTTKDYSKAKFMEHGRGQGNCRIKSYLPSPTIRSEHHGNIEGHYRCVGGIETEDRTKWRRLSIRECARLQSFPDSYVWKCSASSAYKEIGNAVPPVFAWYIFRALRMYFDSL